MNGPLSILSLSASSVTVNKPRGKKWHSESLVTIFFCRGFLSRHARRTKSKRKHSKSAIAVNITADIKLIERLCWNEPFTRWLNVQKKKAFNESCGFPLYSNASMIRGSHTLLALTAYQQCNEKGNQKHEEQHWRRIYY